MLDRKLGAPPHASYNERGLVLRGKDYEIAQLRAMCKSRFVHNITP